MQNNLKRVEVTLELMSTLQRTYTPPSISPIPTKPMQILILQILDKIHQNVHFPVQPKHDTQPPQPHIN